MNQLSYFIHSNHAHALTQVAHEPHSYYVYASRATTSYSHRLFIGDKRQVDALNERLAAVDQTVYTVLLFYMHFIAFEYAS